jgi:Recombination endonuclease VII
MAQMVRNCSKCGEIGKKHYKHPLGKDGLRAECAECSNERTSHYQKINLAKNRARNTAKRKEYREKHPGYQAMATKRFMNADPDRAKGISLCIFWKGVGWRQALRNYQELLAKQNNVCAICKKPEKDRHQSGRLKSLSVDHCHETKKIMGLLCALCNKAEGMLDTVSAKSMVEYKIKYLCR